MVLSSRRATLGTLCCCLLLSSQSVLGTGLKLFQADTLQHIEQARQDRAFMLVLWSLECPPCMKELAMLGRLKQKFPGFELVLISTDSIQLHDEILAELRRHRLLGLPGLENRVYGSAPRERLRYSIDPNWFGELPRYYLYQAGQRRSGSGLSDEALIRRWIAKYSG